MKRLTAKVGDNVKLISAPEWKCVVVQVEGELLHVRTDDGRDVCLHYSWFRKVQKRKEQKASGD